MYSQTLLGPRLCFTCDMSANSHRFYRSKEEIIEAKKEFEYVIIFLYFIKL